MEFKGWLRRTKRWRKTGKQVTTKLIGIYRLPFFIRNCKVNSKWRHTIKNQNQITVAKAKILGNNNWQSRCTRNIPSFFCCPVYRVCSLIMLSPIHWRRKDHFITKPSNDLFCVISVSRIFNWSADAFLNAFEVRAIIPANAYQRIMTAGSVLVTPTYYFLIHPRGIFWYNLIPQSGNFCNRKNFRCKTVFSTLCI